jgi:protein-tyrosine phosphatase
MLEGACNFRDIGGPRTADGRSVRQGMIFRSNHLSSVTARDQALLGRLGITAIYDLRTRLERERSPSAWSSPHVVTHCFSGGHKRRLIDMALKYPPTQAGALALMRQFYRDMPATMARAFGAMIHHMGGGAAPCIIHCSAGKDRTGIAIAVLLAALGVSRADIIADYVRSASLPSLKEDMARAFAHARDAEQILDPYPDDALAVAMDASPAYIEEALNAIDEQFQSVVAYLDAQGVSEKALGDLRIQLLDAHSAPAARVGKGVS